MSELEMDKARRLIQNNFEYFDEVVESAIIDLLEEAGIGRLGNNFVEDLQYTYDIYIAVKKYGKKIS